MTLPDKASLLTATLEPLYSTFHHPREVSPWRLDVCDVWSRAALHLAKIALKEHGAHIEHVICDPNTTARAQYRLGNTARHEFLVDRSDPYNPWVIDGTYLQYAPQDHEDVTPHIMIAPARETSSILAANGIPETLWFQWRVDAYGSGVFRSRAS